jgi:2-oxoglutarate ferredoxin oxidoreductase subunit gamma
VSSKRDDIVELLIPGNELAMKAGNPKATNVVMVGALLGATDIIKLSTVEQTIKEKLGYKKQFIKSNIQLLNDGYNYAKNLIGKKVKA